MKVVNLIALILVIIGAINWGLVGFFDFDLVAFLFKGGATIASRVIYAIIGLAGLWSISFFRYCCGPCDSTGDGSSGSCCSK